MFDKVFKKIQTGISTITTAVKDIANQTTQSRIKVNNKEYLENHLIAEGGFGYIYEVACPQTKRKFALKLINIGNKKQYLQVKNEVELWSKIPKSKNIVDIFDYELTEKKAYIVMELCEEGTLLDYVKAVDKNKIISESEVLNIVYNIANGLSRMHSAKPPIAHRDIKIENILKCGGLFKICDFGSCTTRIFDPNIEDAIVKAEMFDSFERNSTFNYRPPEMCDQYSNYIVNEKVDIWSMGCVIYAVMFKAHPFQDAKKLQIISAQYEMPHKIAKQYSSKLLDLVRFMLTPNPSLRPSAKDIMNIVKNWENGKDIELCEEVQEIKRKQTQEVTVGNVVMMSPEEIEKAQQRLREKEKGNQQNGTKTGTWDFDFGGDGQNNNLLNMNDNNENTNENIVGTTGNNPNILDFDFSSNTETNTQTIPTNNQSENNLNNNILDFDFIEPSTSTQVNQPIQKDNKIEDSTGWDFTFPGSTSKAQITQPSQPSSQQNPTQFFDFQVSNTNGAVQTPSIPMSQPSSSQDNQDILSFFQ